MHTPSQPRFQLLPLGLLAASLLSTACPGGGGGADTCYVGEEACACTSQGACDPGLSCQQGRCLASASTPDAGVLKQDAMVPPDPPATGDPFYADGLDRSVAPCDDFYKFACGGWMARNPLRPNEASRQRLTEAMPVVTTALRTSIETAHANRATTTDPEQAAIGNFHQSCLDAPTQPASRLAVAGLAGMIDPVATLEDLARVSSELRKRGIEGLALLYMSIDPTDSSRYLVTVDQGARSVSNPAFYTDPAAATRRMDYQTHMSKLAAAVGVALDPAAVLRVETALAQAEVPAVDRLDPRNVEHKMTFAELVALAPKFPWRTALDAYGYGPVEFMNARAPSFLRALDGMLTSIPLADWKHYLRWQLIEKKAPFLDQPVLDVEFDFHERLVGGRTEPRSRTSICLGATADQFEDELARMFVETRFDPATRSMALGLTMSVRDAFARRIMSLPWLDPETRANAQKKLAAVVAQVGYPDDLPRITGMLPQRSYWETHLEDTLASARSQVGALNARRDRARSWITAPTTLNAFYRANANAIAVPAAILLPPLFDARRSAVGNYAAIGAVIGHEFTHGFDSRGRHYDETGSLHSWWTMNTDVEFTGRGMCVVDFFDKIEMQPGKFVNGRVCLGENIADMGGVRVAYEAMLQAAGATPAFQGFDVRQQFFIGYAQNWCQNSTEQEVARRLVADNHAPNPARVFGPLSNMPEFADAFACPAVSPMRAAPPCVVW